jgi:hypothetical protein
MAAWVNKWLIVLNPVWVWGIIGVTNQQVPRFNNGKNELVHPFHVSVIEVNHSISDKSLEISCKRIIKPKLILFTQLIRQQWIH